MAKMKNKKDIISSIKKYIKNKGYAINTKKFSFEIKPFIDGSWNGDYCNIEHWYKEAKRGAFDLKFEIAIYSHFCPIWFNPKHELTETLFNIPKNIYLKE